MVRRRSSTKRRSIRLPAGLQPADRFTSEEGETYEDGRFDQLLRFGPVRSFIVLPAPIVVATVLPLGAAAGTVVGIVCVQERFRRGVVVRGAKSQ